jgi:hypothetical protein
MPVAVTGHLERFHFPTKGTRLRVTPSQNLLMMLVAMETRERFHYQMKRRMAIAMASNLRLSVAVTWYLECFPVKVRRQGLPPEQKMMSCLQVQKKIQGCRSGMLQTMGLLGNSQAEMEIAADRFLRLEMMHCREKRFSLPWVVRRGYLRCRLE